MRATNRLTVTMSVSFRATLAYGSGQGNVGLREKSRTITFGQLLPVTLSPDRTPEGLLHFGTCRKGNSGSSANADRGTAFSVGRQYAGQRPFSR